VTWKGGPLKYWLRLNDSGVWGDEPTGGDGTPVVRSTNITLDGSWSLEEVAKRALTSQDRRAKRLAAGDLVVVTSSGSAAHLGKTAIVDHEVEKLGACFANFVQRLRPTAVADSRFVWYVLNSTKASAEMEMLGNTTTGLRNLNGSIVGSVEFPGPSLDEQRAISDFLDTEAARIDAIIGTKRRMIRLLQERVTSQIDCAFDTVAASEHLPSLSAVVHIAEGQVDPRLEPYSELPLIAPNHIESGTGRLLEVESAGEQGAISGKYLCQQGDVVYSKIRPALRKVCVAPTLCLTSADMYPLRPIDALDPAFLFYFLLSQRFTDFAVMESERVAMPKINRDALGRIRIPLPPKAAQRHVVDELDAARERADVLVVRLVHQVSLLQEHRQALITAAVTGELEVPGVAA
jgi:type I restriction enzyme, S subunit